MTADGTTIASASLEHVTQGIMPHDGGLLQTAYGDGEYLVEYNEDGLIDIVEWEPH